MFPVLPLGPLEISIPLVFFLLAFVLSWELFLRLAEAEHLSLTPLWRQGPWLLLAYLLGGRLVAVVSLYQIYLADLLRIVVIWDGNFSFLGGGLGFAVGLFLVIQNQRSTFLQWFDALLPALTLGIAVNWFGEFFGGTSYGRPTNLPWGVIFEGFGVRYTVPVQPVQIYAAVFFLLLTLLLLTVRMYRWRAGAETIVGVTIGGVGAFLLEFLRGDFAITVFAKVTDFLLLVALFGSLGIVALLEQRPSDRATRLYAVVLVVVTVLYLVFRPWITIAEVEWRLSQFLYVLAMIATAVYVVVHRWKYPHL